MNYREKYETYIADSLLSVPEKNELLAIEQNDDEIQERFYDDIHFGTAGLRALIRAGRNGMNLSVIRMATQALCHYLASTGQQQRGVVIGYDSRNMSPEFAYETACVLCGNGIKAYLFESLRSVPQLSYAVRYLDCIAGIEITASHNPAIYNGYKVYDENGGQLPPDPCEMIENEMRKIADLSETRRMDEDEARKKGLWNTVSPEADEAYIKGILALSQRAEVIKRNSDMPIVYTPLHGAGLVPVTRVLRELGFNQVSVVPEQELPDGDFPTVIAPNPEEDDALAMAIALAGQTKARLVVATDPDADRMACALPVDGGYQKLTGNQTAVLLLDYILGAKAEKGRLPRNGLIAKSMISTAMADAIAAAHGLKVQDVMTGFRFISESIEAAQREGRDFLFGFEESFGYLTGDISRDKDGILSAMLICEAAAYHAENGRSLMDALQALYRQYGYYMEHTFSVPFPGMTGLQDMTDAMERLRSNPPAALCGKRVTAIRDYLSGIRAAADGAMENLDCASGNALYYELEDNCWACLRPSGTEPKLKAYVGVKTADEATAKALLDELRLAVEGLLKQP